MSFIVIVSVVILPLFVWYQICIDEEIDAELASRLKDVIKRHQGTLVESEDEATHIIYSIPSSAKEDASSKSSLVSGVELATSLILSITTADKDSNDFELSAY